MVREEEFHLLIEQLKLDQGCFWMYFMMLVGLFEALTEQQLTNKPN